ncbi:MAG: hypothetical protein WC526_04090 [Patescibacteria group bacterium]
MKFKEVVYVIYIDVGGVLFPDFPNRDTEPNYEMVQLIRQVLILWHNPKYNYHFIVANIKEHRRDIFEKNLHLLISNDIFNQLGLPDESYFFRCAGPEKKGEAIGVHINGLNYPGLNIGAAVFDNSLAVLQSMPPWVQCFGFQLKDRGDPGVQDWYRKHKHSRNFHDCESIDMLARRVVYVHLSSLRRLIKKSPPSERHILDRLYHLEELRTEQIFKFYDIETEVTLASLE